MFLKNKPMSSLVTKCGLFGIRSKSNSLIQENVVTGLKKLQHRGQESAGISYHTSKEIVDIKGIGLVKDIFKTTKFDKNTSSCIGHVRYSTSGNSKKDKQSELEETQPINMGIFALAHNGNIPNLSSLITTFQKYISNKKENVSDTIILSEILNNIILSKNSSTPYLLYQGLIEIINKVPGVYCLLVLYKDSIIAVRDRYGIRPLCYGEKDGDFAISSESCALQDFKKVRDIRPGEIVKFTDKVETIYQYSEPKNVLCLFEYIYFLNPKTDADNHHVYSIRYESGKILASQEDTLDNNCIVIGIPNTGISGGKGYAEQSGLVYEQYITKNLDYHRSFIQPNNTDRYKVCSKKYIYDWDKLRGKNIVLVDDSIVRGNTMKAIIKLLRENGVNEIHLRINSPPVISPCYYGIDIPSYDELIANKLSIEEIKDFINADSLIYLELDKMIRMMKERNKDYDYCCSCFNNKYSKELLEW